VDPDELRRRLRLRPFQPFRIVLKDGESFEVRHPYINLLARTFIKIGIPEPNSAPDTRIADHTVFVLLSQIDRIEPLPAAASPVS
jgi:hypothetical protein